MSLVTLIKDIFKKEETKKEEPKNKALMVVLVPKKKFEDRSYKDEKGLVSKINKTYFDSCALDLSKAILDTYGESFDFRKTMTQLKINDPNEKTVRYEFSRGKTKINYTITGRDRFQSASDDYEWSNDIMAQFGIVEEKIDFEKVSKLLKEVMKTHLLDYTEHQPMKFGLFYSEKTDNAPQGIELLKKMGIRPTEAAEYISVMIYGAYTHKKFSEEELAQLFPESRKRQN